MTSQDGNPPESNEAPEYKRTIWAISARGASRFPEGSNRMNQRGRLSNHRLPMEASPRHCNRRSGNHSRASASIHPNSRRGSAGESRKPAQEGGACAQTPADRRAIKLSPSGEPPRTFPHSKPLGAGLCHHPFARHFDVLRCCIHHGLHSTQRASNSSSLVQRSM